jgi:glycogen debranching enzyme
MLNSAFRRYIRHVAIATALGLLGGLCHAADSLELSRPARPWEFACSVGQSAGMFGNEAGQFEAWVYPLKILRNFHLRFLAEGRVIPAETVVRTATARPESFTLVYSGDTFSVRETFFVPVNESGAIIKIDVETEQPFEVRAAFERDFQLEWPAALGGTFEDWDKELRAFTMGEETKRFAAIIGSPTAGNAALEYANNYSSSRENSLDLGVTTKGRDSKIVVIAGSVNGRPEATKTYRHLLADYAALERQSAEYYRGYLSKTVSLELPDAQIQQAYDWSRISVLQGLVTNPFLGTGLVAGYRTSGETQRPGFAWYFGRDSFWTSFALNSQGDFASTKTALEFISKFQRADGKMPHEISQGANFVDWFKGYPYPYASADATPLYIIAVNDYVHKRGDVEFARQKWDSLWKAYQFLKSTYDSQGLPRNFEIGHGWVEGGPLLPVKTELYQSGLGAVALDSLSQLAQITGKQDVSRPLQDEFKRQQQLVNQAFWLTEQKRFAFALDQENQAVDELSVLATVPMWFGLLDSEKAQSTISQLAGHDHSSDWGMRIIGSGSSKYSAGGYHFGSVWPLFTGWASVGEYKYHQALPAYLNLRQNALLALDGSLGHVTEVLSGDYYQPIATSSPHQIWSAAMVISPVLRGMLGLDADAVNHRVNFAPHVPADWDHCSIHNLHVANSTIELNFRRTADEVTLELKNTGEKIEFSFSPAFSPRAKVSRAALNGKAAPFNLASEGADQHAVVQFSLMAGSSVLKLSVRNDFSIGLVTELPPLGSDNRGLHVLSQSWTGNGLEVSISGAAGATYQIPVWNPRQIATVDGAELVRKDGEFGALRIRIAATSSEPYPHEKIMIHFIK